VANARDINLDIVGHDKTGRATRSAGNNLDHLKRKADAAKKSTDRMTAGQQVLVRRAEQSAVALGKMVGAASAAVAVLPIFGAAVAKAAVAAAKLVSQIGPAAAGLLPLAAGFLLVRQTLVSAGPAMLKAIEPVTAAWRKQQEYVGRLASEGLRPLAREFARVNLHLIGRAQERIASAVNRTARSTLRWVNTLEGQRIISTIGDATARTFERLAPKAEQVARAVARLAGRAAGSAFQAFGDGAAYAADKVTEFLDSISSSDIATAFERIRGYADRAGSAMRRIGDALEWIEEHETTINRVRTALATLAVVVGVATGGWMIALGGAAALIAMNWDKVTAAFDRVRARAQQFVAWFRGLDTVRANVDTFRGAVDNLRQGWDNFVNSVRPKVQPFLDRLQVAFIKMQPLIGAVAAIVGVLGKAFLTVAGPVAGAILTALGVLISAFGDIAVAAAQVATTVLRTFAALIRPIATVAQKLGLPFADAFAEAADDADTAAGKMDRSLNSVKTDVARTQINQLQNKINSLKGKTVKTEADRQAIAAAQQKIRELQGTINSLHGKTVTNYVITRNIVEYQNHRAGERGQAGFSRPSGRRNAPKFATGDGSMWGPAVGGAIRVQAGTTNVDARVYIDGREITAITRSTIHDEQSRAAYRARYGRVA
jgi:TolA-binding protein